MLHQQSPASHRRNRRIFVAAGIAPAVRHAVDSDRIAKRRWRE